MCGIYGYIGKTDKYTADMLRSLAVLNESRGTDSTGIGIISNNKVKILKQVVKASQFVESVQWDKHIGIDNQSIILGHTRYATHGAITRENAHPHKIGNIVFTHNGVINNFYDLQERYKTNLQVDSQIIPYLLNRNRYSWVFSRALRGSFVAPFVNLNYPNRLYIARYNNPLTLGITNNGIYYTSQLDHMFTASEICVPDLNIFETKDSSLYIIENNEVKNYKLNISRQFKSIDHVDVSGVRYYFNKWYDK